MPLQTLCCSLEMGKRLDELGIKIPSLHRHVAFVDYGNGQRLWSPKGWYLVRHDDPMFGRPRIEEEWVNAPMAGELLALFPTDENITMMMFDNGHAQVCLHARPSSICENDSLANALAKLLIHLKEQGIV